MSDRQLRWWPMALRVARKEFRTFFASPAAYLFLASFLAAVLFSFFWVETFFARNIADVRPLFDWLPLLLIFLIAALTMRLWSEERRSGTLESLLTAPVTPWSLVLGKFMAVMMLVVLALVLTLPLPVTVAALGTLDWGPVIGGYIATLLLAASYTAIGLAVSVRSDNAIISLIVTTVVCALLHFIGSPALTNLLGQPYSRWLDLFGTGARFESIGRGVLDLRDLVYFASLAGVFLVLNVFTLEKLRWAGNPSSTHHRSRTVLALLLAANIMAVNFWLVVVPWLRLDLTQGRIFTLSEATRRQLNNLKEPLIIRGYFSAKTHPYLAPLVPQLEDLLREYAVAAGSNAKVKIIDPTHDRAAEEEAASRYGVRPVPFQTANRYQVAVVNSYFDIVVSYGDQVEKLGFKDLIEVKGNGDEGLTVVLKNPEYEITRAIRKAVNAFKSGGNVFQSLTKPVQLNAYFSPDARLPEPLRQLRTDLKDIVAKQMSQTQGKFKVVFKDPDADGGKLAQELRDKYGLAPKIASLMDPQPFWFSMLLNDGAEVVQVPFPDKLDEPSLKRTLESALKRLSPGFLKTIGFVQSGSVGVMPGNGLTYSRLNQTMSENARLHTMTLADGRVPDDVDLLFVAAPHNLNDKQRFAIDQFLMRGGPVVVATSPYAISMNTGITATRQKSGLEDWLASFGISEKDGMVVDSRSATLPIPVQRSFGGLPFREIQMLRYPHFPDLRGDSLNPDNPMTRSLQQLTLNWVSPLVIDKTKTKGLKVTELLKSSADSYLSHDMNLVPDVRNQPPLGFKVEGGAKPRILALALQGRFTSFYKGKASPLAGAPSSSVSSKVKASNTASSSKVQPSSSASSPSSKSIAPTSIVEHSPDNAKLIIIGSNTFASDMTIDMASEGLSTLYTKPLEFLQNTVDWALEDPALLSLRGRTQLARTLKPLTEQQQRMWEMGNYLLALAGLIVVWGWRCVVARTDARRAQRILEGV